MREMTATENAERRIYLLKQRILMARQDMTDMKQRNDIFLKAGNTQIKHWETAIKKIRDSIEPH